MMLGGSTCTSPDAFRGELASTTTRSTIADFTPTPQARSGKLDSASRFGAVEPAVFPAHTEWEQRLESLPTTQMEWEHRLKSLDQTVIDSLLTSPCRRPRQKDVELLQGQMKALSDQVASFASESAALAQVVGELRQQRERDSADLGVAREQARREQQDGQEEVMALVASLHQLIAEHREESKGTLKAVQDSQSSSVAELWSANAKLWKEFRRREQDHASLQHRLSASEEAAADAAIRFSAVQDSHLEYTELFSKHYQDFQVLKSSHAQHAGFRERLAFLEQLVGDCADWHGSVPQEQLSQAPQAQSERMRGRSPGVRSSALGWCGEMDSANVGEVPPRGEATLKARLDEVERAFDLQADWCGSLVDRQGEVESHQATLEERVQLIEQETQVSATKMESYANRMTLLREAWAVDTPTETPRRS